MGGVDDVLALIMIGGDGRQGAAWKSAGVMTVGVVAVVVGALWVYMVWPVRKVRHIVCPPYKVPGLGHLGMLVKKEAQVFVEMAEAYGPVYRMHIGRQPIVMVADAELCRQLCTTHFKSAMDRACPTYIQTVPLLQHALFFGRGKKWSSMRNIVLPFYHSDQMCKYVPLMGRIADAMVRQLETKENEDVNISLYTTMFTLDIIGETAFGESFQMIEGLGSPKVGRTTMDGHEKGTNNRGEASQNSNSLESKLVQSANKFINGLRLDKDAPLSTIIGELFPFLQKPMRKVLSSIPWTKDWKMEEHTSTLMEVLKEILEKRKGDANLNTRIDMLSLLLNVHKHNNEITEDYINGLTFEILLLGSDTTAITLSNCLYYISCHPHVEHKILQEVDAFGPRNSQLSYDDLNRFPYLEQVFKETLRICTPAPVIARLITNDIQIGGFNLKKGTHVWMTPNAIMRDPRYFKNPDEFNPDRFDLGCIENKERHPYAFMPFGLGPRACIGTKFSAQEAKIALIKLYQNFTFTHSLNMEKPLAFDFGIVRRPKYGIKLRVHRRH